MALAFRLPSFRYASLHFISPHFSPLLSPMEAVVPPDTLSWKLGGQAQHDYWIGLTADADHEGSEVPFSVSTC